MASQRDNGWVGKASLGKCRCFPHGKLTLNKRALIKPTSRPFLFLYLLHPLYFLPCLHFSAPPPQTEPERTPGSPKIQNFQPQREEEKGLRNVELSLSLKSLTLSPSLFPLHPLPQLLTDLSQKTQSEEPPTPSVSISSTKKHKKRKGWRNKMEEREEEGKDS